MSFGDPNNPYGQPNQPGYGQQPQGQPGYGYPQAPAMQQPYGYPGGQMEMPGGVKTARVFLWIIAGLQIIGAIFAFVGMAAVDSLADGASAQGADVSAFQNLSQGLLVFVAILSLVFAGLAIALAVKFKTGGNGVRVCSIVLGSFVILGGVLSLPLGIVSIAMGVLIIVFVAKADGATWFKRPRY